MVHQQLYHFLSVNMVKYGDKDGRLTVAFGQQLALIDGSDSTYKPYLGNNKAKGKKPKGSGFQNLMLA